MNISALNSREITRRLGRENVIHNVSRTYHSSRFLYVGLSLGKTLSWGKTKYHNCPIIHLQISSPRKHHEKSEKDLTTMTWHQHYQHQEGGIVACRSPVNAINTNKETILHHWPATRPLIYPPKVPIAVVILELELIRSNSRANTSCLSRTSLPIGKRIDETIFFLTCPHARI
jgi:hypothetical protein